jgi:hypothetical protein
VLELTGFGEFELPAAGLPESELLALGLAELELPAAGLPELERPAVEPRECELPAESGEGTLALDHGPVPVLDDEVLPLVVACVDALLVEPGSTAATAPATSTLPTLTVAVAAVSLRRPRSRSATAIETCRAAARRRGAPVRSSQLSMFAVWHT